MSRQQPPLRPRSQAPIPPPKIPSRLGPSPRVIIVTILLMVVAFGAGYGAITVQAATSQPLASGNVAPHDFVVQQNDTTNSIATSLESQKIIRSAFFFKLYIRFKRITFNVQPGTYQLSPSMKLDSIITILTTPQVFETVQILIPEGLRLTQYPDAILNSLKDVKLNPKNYALPNFSATDFLNIAVTTGKFDTSDTYWFAPPWDTSPKGGAKAAFEGYLFPAQYEISTKSTTVDIIKLMLRTFAEKLCPGPNYANIDQYIFDQAMCKAHQATITFDPITDPYKADVGKPIGVFDALAAHKLTLPQAVTIASLAQREARSALHFQLVSSVYYNRTENIIGNDTAGFLGADPSEQYAIGSNATAGTDPWKNLNDTGPAPYDSPYNLAAAPTGHHTGLPPSAIAGVSLNALYAAINPPATTYFYFVYGKPVGGTCNNFYFHNYNEVKSWTYQGNQVDQGNGIC